jgi:FkbM family methyltransferase
MKEALKIAFYELIDLITLRRGIPRTYGEHKIRFPARNARYYQADYEPDLFRFLKQNLRAGDTYWDCGAHFGLFSVVASRLVGPTGMVLAFEPTPSVREILTKVVSMNKAFNVVVRPEALSDRTGETVFYVIDNEASNANSLVKQARHSRGITIHTSTIDDIASELNVRADLIKIDVEGAEFALLKGARGVIEAYRPLLYLGLHPAAIANSGATLSEVFDLLEEFRYRVIWRGEVMNRQSFSRQADLFDVECFPVDKK